MRICLLSREYPPETGWGGIATYTYHLAHGLKTLGHQVEVVSLSSDTDKERDDQGIRVHRVSRDWAEGQFHALSMYMPTTRYVLVASTALWRKFQQLHQIEPFDVIDSPELLAEGIYPAIIRSLPRVVRLYTPHSKFIRENLNAVYSNFDHELVASMERLTMLSADVLTSPSEDLANYVASDLNCEINEIHIVRNPVDPTVFSPEGPRAIESNGWINILFVGRLEERKGIEYLVRAIPRIAARHDSVRLTIIGEDTNATRSRGSVREYLDTILQRDRTSRYVNFISRVPLFELPRYYRSAYVSIVPSIYDNSPYSCLEAMSCGTPVIGTTGGGTKEYLVDGESGITIPPGDPDAIADAVISLIESPAKRNMMGISARQRVLEAFDRKEIARQTVALYELAIEKHRSSPLSPLYLRDTGRLEYDTMQLVSAFDRMILEIARQTSPVLQVKYLAVLLVTRPRYFFSAATLRLLQIFRLLPESRFRFLNRLERRLTQTITAGKERPPEL